MLQHRIYDKPTQRLIVEAMVYRMRVGCPWRGLPVEFECCNLIYQSLVVKRQVNEYFQSTCARTRIGMGMY